MREFEKEIVLKIRDRTRSTMERIRRTQERIRQSTANVNRETGRITSNIRKWASRVQAVRRSYDAVRRSISAVGRAARNAAVVATGGLTAAGFAVNRQSQGIVNEARQAETLNADPNQLRQLLAFLERAGGFDRQEAFEVIKDLSVRQQQAIREIERARAEGRDGASGVEFEVLRELGLISRLNQDAVSFFSDFLNATRNSDTQRQVLDELLSDAGVRLLPVVNLGVDRIEEIQRAVEQFTPTIDQAAIDRALAFNDAMANLRDTFQGFAERVIGPLTPIIERIVEATASAIEGINNDELERRISAVAASISGFIDTLETIANRIAGIVDSVSGFTELFIGKEVAGSNTPGDIRTTNAAGQTVISTQATRILESIDQRRQRLENAENRLNNPTILDRLTGSTGDFEREIVAVENEIAQLRSQLAGLAGAVGTTANRINNTAINAGRGIAVGSTGSEQIVGPQ